MGEQVQGITIKKDLISKEIKANKQKRMQENRKARIGTKADPPKQVIQ